jgi:excisionase family DNA binding protein
MSDNDASLPWLITVEQAAKLLCISRTKLYQMVARGEVPYVRFSADTGEVDRGAIRFNPISLQAWLKQLEESKKPGTGF